MPVAKKRKIVQHYLYSGLGGHGNVFFSMVKADTTKEFDYNAIFCGVEPLREEYVNNCEELQLPYTYLKKNRGFDFGAYLKTYRLFRNNRPSVIFLHGVSYSIIPAFWYKLARPGIKIIVRDTQAHHLKSKTEWFWMFFCLLLAKHIVFLTQVSADGIKRKFGGWARKKKMVIIPNGLDITMYQPLTRINHQGPFRIGMQSRLQPIKDHPLLINAFKQLKEMNPGRELTLHIAGEGETMPQIQSLVTELGLTSSVKLHGMLNGPELCSFMKTLDIYVHATFGETLSNSIMQAMACGLPVVASNVWGVNNMIEDGKNGLLTTKGDIAGLTAILHRLVDNMGERKTLGASARKYAEDHFDNKVMFNSYRQLF